MTLTFSDEGRTYEWVGGFGAIFASYERGKQVGDVRVLFDRMFYVAYSQPRSWGRAPRVCWSLPDVTIEQIHEVQRRIFPGA